MVSSSQGNPPSRGTGPDHDLDRARYLIVDRGADNVHSLDITHMTNLVTKDPDPGRDQGKEIYLIIQIPARGTGNVPGRVPRRPRGLAILGN